MQAQKREARKRLKLLRRRNETHFELRATFASRVSSFRFAVLSFVEKRLMTQKSCKRDKSRNLRRFQKFCCFLSLICCVLQQPKIAHISTQFQFGPFVNEMSKLEASFFASSSFLGCQSQTTPFSRPNNQKSHRKLKKRSPKQNSTRTQKVEIAFIDKIRANFCRKLFTFALFEFCLFVLRLI